MDYFELKQELARLEIAEQDLQEEISSLYNSHQFGGVLIESRAERLSEEINKVRASITDVKLQIVKFKEKAYAADNVTRLSGWNKEA